MMKFILLISMAIVFTECQYYYNPYNPRVANSAAYFAGEHYHRPYNWLLEQQKNVVITDSNDVKDEPINPVIIEDHVQGRTMQSLQEEVMPRFFFNQGNNNAAIYRPGGYNRRTILYTTTETKTVVTTTNCIPGSFFQGNGATCARRRRDIEAIVKDAMVLSQSDEESEVIELQDSSSTNKKVETTSIPQPFIWQGKTTDTNRPEEILSSKEDSEENGAARIKRFFFLATATTFTELSFTTTTFTQRVSLRIVTNNGQNCPIGAGNPGCQLACIPKGYTTC